MRPSVPSSDSAGAAAYKTPFPETLTVSYQLTSCHRKHRVT